MAAMGTLESFMHHPANDRSWPKAEAQVTFFSVSFGEIPWFWKEKFSNLGFDGAVSPKQTLRMR